MAISKQCRYLKDRLISLAAAQVKAKRARKRLPEAELAALRRELSGSDDPSWSAQRDVVYRQSEVTACLNLYHEVRGSAHRHGIPEGRQWKHDSVLSRLRQELAGLG